VLWPVNGGNASGVVGFVAGAKMDEAGIIGICRNRLPRYMVPARVCFIDDIPLNNNGKVDRFRLKQLLEEGL
jgi:acyl-CoA synthetase (AMP-forming)/AMP-acid ligase II